MVAVFESRIGAAPICAKSTRKVSRVLWWACVELAMSGNGDGEERWSKDDLFDLHSALSFGVRIEEIAFFSGGAKSKTFPRMQSAEFRKTWTDSVEQSQSPIRQTPCGLVRGT
jgi:hypothetical protein